MSEHTQGAQDLIDRHRAKKITKAELKRLMLLAYRLMLRRKWLSHAREKPQPRITPAMGRRLWRWCEAATIRKPKSPPSWACEGRDVFRNGYAGNDRG